MKEEKKIKDLQGDKVRILSFCKKWKKLEQRYFSTLIEYVDYAWNVVKDNLIRLYPQYGEYRDIPYLWEKKQ